MSMISRSDVSDETFRLLKFLEPSGTRIETLTLTSWGGHIPFMFCLMNYFRPRTFVELGTHYGASFFAACQAIREFDINCTPTAVDLWSGDEHAGKYGEKVYTSFRRIHQDRYHGVGRVLRKDFNEAAVDFENLSLDLIHIDGLHTYEAVKNDYETWLSKASPNGVMLFHDTDVRERGFGVWKLWDEIKDDYVSFNFTHTHGLGVIALGSADSNPIIPILQAVNCSENSKSSFDNFFRLAGERAVSEAISQIKLQAIRDRLPEPLVTLFRRSKAIRHRIFPPSTRAH
ncbi:class I SAM-dependent methyltransferase [Nitrosomonas sp. Is37]|uniref:class I SAM-dependent methyltransferase n=1 Tax=Nitrosomonas sp. Is37 TaxID=3080535 RepID=UPI00294B9471|nr:class I SAM-dependent methyltransferase [Nitrosomonas sp. Is37]MDV6345075.1 class I SAM-dependent methyltransferase [Nitrosomonas sp. Is37]